ncbi:MAG TPA: hypothetical protein VLX68_03010 [Chitinivibrionales bacterium]|nr:hypothetical protein [Chitinivibrionales bacterium]
MTPRRPQGIAILILLIAGFVFPASREPVPLGYSMATFGAIIQQKGISGREPFTPACFYADTFRYGVTVAGIDYFDPMDNLESSHMVQVGLGGFCSVKGFTAKLSFAHFDALRIYFEQQGTLSLGTTKIPFVNPSVEISGYRAGLYTGDEPAQTRLDAGASALIPFRIAAISLSCLHIPLKNAATEGYTAPFTVRAGVHTTANALGSQGILCEAEDDGQWRFRLSLAEEYWVFNRAALAAAFTTNPVMISFGVTVAWRGTAVNAAFADHPVLGWSKGLTIDWAGK